MLFSAPAILPYVAEKPAIVRANDLILPSWKVAVRRAREAQSDPVMALFPTPLFIPVTASLYQVARSLRLRAANSSWLSRSFTSTGNQLKFTLSMWVKRGTLGTSQTLFSAPPISGSNEESISFDTSDRLVFRDGSAPADLTVTTASYRDPTAWMHVMYVYDSAQVTQANRGVFYVNGVAQAAGTNVIGASRSTAAINVSGKTHSIGRFAGIASSYFDGLIAGCYFIDGQALAPTDFGKTDTTTGVWVPISYAGTFGTTGFYLPFSDNSGATAATIGKDTSGNGNNWTPSGISVTAGATNDSLVDTPTNYGTDTGVGGEVRGNYATFNALEQLRTTTVADGNLKATFTGAAAGSGIRASAFPIPLSGKWRAEFTVLATHTNAAGVGISRIDGALNTTSNWTIGTSANDYAWLSYSSGTASQKYNNGVTASYGTAFDTVGVVVGIEYDADAGTLRFWRNGVDQGIAYTFTPGGQYAFACSGTNNWAFAANFGQQPFMYPGTAGFKALCTQNLLSTTVALPSTFTGNANADGPFVLANGVVTAVTINGNVATRGTHFDAVAGGIKLRTSSASYNASGSNTVTTYTAGSAFKYARAQAN